MAGEFNNGSDSSDSEALFIDETMCDDGSRSSCSDMLTIDDKQEAVPEGSQRSDETIQLDDSLNTTVLEIPTLSNLASPSETQLTQTERNSSIISISSGGKSSADCSFVKARNSVVNESILFLPSKDDDVFEARKNLIQNDQPENGAKTAPVSDNDEPMEEFLTAQDTTPVIEEKFECSFLLKVTCSIVYSKESRVVIEKKVKKVEVTKPAVSSLSDMDKRTSLSSSGSIYSDKSGLPFPLKPRVSVATSSTSTSEEAHPKVPLLLPERIKSSSTAINEDAATESDQILTIPSEQPWANDCLLTLGCDEALQKKINLGRAKITPVNRVSLASNELLKKCLNTSKDLNPKVEVPETAPTPKRKRGRPKGSSSTATAEEGPQSTPKRTYRRRNLSTASSKEKGSLEFESNIGSRKRPRKDDGPSGVKKRNLKDKGSTVNSLTQEECMAWNFLPGLDVDETTARNVPVGDESESGALGPIPTEPVFKGMQFMLCYVLPKKHSKKPTKSSSNSDFSESENEKLYEALPFHPQHLIKQITAGGGAVRNNFNELTDQDANQIYLVTNRPNCSAKFLLCLLSKIKILHHSHIIEACRSGLTRSMRLQHSGWSKVHGRWMEIPRNIHTTLKGNSIHLLPQSFEEPTETYYQAFWFLILEKLGAKIVKDLDYESADLIVTYQPPLKQMMDSLTAVGTMAPALVTIEWLKECIIQGCPVSMKSHPSFRVTDDSDSSF